MRYYELGLVLGRNRVEFCVKSCHYVLMKFGFGDAKLLDKFESKIGIKL